MTHQDAHTHAEARDVDAIGDQAAAATGPAPLDPQAAAELAQELTLVTRALFAQLLPATAHNAIAGIPEVGSRPVAVPPAAEQAPLPNQGAPTAQAEGGAVPGTAAAVAVEVTAPAAAAGSVAPASTPVTSAPALVAPVALPVPGSVPVPATAASAPSAPVTPPAPTAPAPAPAAALPVPGLPIERPATVDNVPPVEAPRPVRRRSTAVLEEIAFLDE